MGVVVVSVYAAALSAALEPEDRGQVLQLIRQYKQVADDAAARDKVIHEIVLYGPEARALLRKQLERELSPLLRRYEQMFERAAQAAVRARRRQVDQDRVRDLRRQFLDVRSAGDLTKTLIVEKADPALKELAELLAVSRDEVLGKDDTLGKLRDQLEGAAAGWRSLTSDSTDDLLTPIEQPIIAELGAMTSYDRRALGRNAQLADQLGEQEALGIAELNRMRMLLGLKAMVIDLKLCEASRGHSRDMAERGFFSHDSPVPGKKTPWDRARAAGTSAAGECIAAGTQLGVKAIEMWWHSPGHFKIIMSDHPRVGLGRAEAQWTLLVGR